MFDYVDRILSTIISKIGATFTSFGTESRNRTIGVIRLGELIIPGFIPKVPKTNSRQSLSVSIALRAFLELFLPFHY